MLRMLLHNYYDSHRHPNPAILSVLKYPVATSVGLLCMYALSARITQS